MNALSTTSTRPKRLISVVVPLYNEEKNIPLLFRELQKSFQPLPYLWRAVFVNDGSTDASGDAIEKLAKKHVEIQYLELSRNFGKEIATTAGLHAAKGDAVLCIDADLQHPPSLIPRFIKEWERGAEIVVGVRKQSRSDTWVKRCGSFLFYKLMNMISDTAIIPRATDFRLLDRVAVNAFKRMPERNRMTRGLIDWLGFRRALIRFDAHDRKNGTSVYSPMKLFRLATASIISMSLLPLKLAGYLGIFIVFFSGILGAVMISDRFILHSSLHFSGPAILATIILFLVGIVLVCIGLLAVYIAHIHQQTQGRPLYVIRKRKL